MKTRLKPSRENDREWEWAIGNGRIFQVTTPGGDRRFDVLLLGQADYVMVNVDKSGNFDPKGELKLFSVNGEFRMWVEGGLKGPIRGVRWAVQRYSDGDWSIGTSTDRLAIEQLMGEYVDAGGKAIDMPS